MTRDNDESNAQKPMQNVWELPFKISSAYWDAVRVATLLGNGLARAHLEFFGPYLTASNSFWAEEAKKLPKTPLEANLRDYHELLRFNAQIALAGLNSSFERMLSYHRKDYERFLKALAHTLEGGEHESLDQYWAEKAALMQRLVVDYPDAIQDIGAEFGFHPEHKGYSLFAETERMALYQVSPNQPGVEIRENCKPIIIAHPYVLGSGILTFLPREQKSYAHAFANQGVPTYLRIVKDIENNEAVQTMNGEDDAQDTAYFCRLVRERHGKPVTLNGFCQGGFICLCDVLSSRLEGLVDALITCVAPMDGTRSSDLVEYLQHIVPRFRDLAYATKTLPSGNQVIDGKVMSWVYKLKSIEREAPVFTFYRDLALFEQMLENGVQGVGKTAAAINHWLVYERTDLPIPITQMSFDSYTIPISAHGDLPVSLFGRRLNLGYLQERGIKFQICYAAKDDLVDPPSATAPADFVDVELTEFPKGHAAIATSWSHPDTEWALHKRYPIGTRGPVRFHLDLDDELESLPE